MNEIDEGFNKNVATTIAGSITFKMIERGSVVNGEVNDYKFELTTSVPMQPNDVIKFSFPPEVAVNAKGQATTCKPENVDD